MTTFALGLQMPLPGIDEVAKDPGTSLGILGVLGGLALYLRRVFKNMGLEDKARDLEVEKISGAEDVIALLRGEVTRLAEMNKILSSEIRILQGEIIALRTENTSLQTEIEGLNSQISRFRLSSGQFFEDKDKELPPQH